MNADDTRWLDAVQFDANGLIPAIAQDHATGRVLMLAWMNREALAQTVAKGQAVYWSRSRQQLWHKGETSGHWQQVHAIRLDCDSDALVLSVTQVGGIACHTGRESCFYQLLTDDNGTHTWITTDAVRKDPQAIYGTQADEAQTQTHAYNDDAPNATARHAIPPASNNILPALEDVLYQRKTARADSSYVASLYQKGADKILQKVGEEAVEMILAAKTYQQTDDDTTRDALIYECADLWFHIMVTLAWFNIPLDAVTQELARRFGLSGLDEKRSRTQG